MSWAQQRLWFIDQFAPNTPIFNESCAVQLNSPVNIDALRRSLNEVIRRHATLRTTFDEVDGEPVQIVAPSLTVDIALVDVRGSPPNERDSKVRRLATVEAARPFDLRRGPLVRTFLYRLDSSRYVFFLCTHHIVCDGWSLGILQTELSALYSAFLENRRSPLKDLPLSYTDFAMWQRRSLRATTFSQQCAYWREKLRDVPRLELWIDHPRPSVQGFRGSREPVLIGPATRARLERFSEVEGATLFMTLLATFKALLYRHTGQDDIVVGVPVANRNHKDVEGLIGHFVNTLVLRTKLSGSITYREVLRRVRDTALGAYDNQDVPFEAVVQELNPPRDPSRHPLFQVAFQVFKAPKLITNLTPGLTAFDVQPPIAKFDLRLDLLDSGTSLDGFIEYDADLFEATTMRRMAGHFRTLTDAALSAPDILIADLQILQQSAIRQIMNAARPDTELTPEPRCVDEIVGERARECPHLIAVTDGVRSITYGELTRRAGCVAHALSSMSVDRDTAVAIYLERSMESIVATLGVLKAGGAFLPIDTEYPQARVQLLLEDCSPAVVITTATLRPRLPDCAPVLLIEELSHGENLRDGRRNSLDQLAYIIYTSGSTGRPKGVMVTHRGIPRLAVRANYISIDARDRLAQVANYCFDAAIFEIFGALFNGAELVIAPKEIVLSPDKFERFLTEQGITVLFLTTELFHRLAREKPSMFRSLKWLLFGGSATDARIVRAVRSSGVTAKMLNMYGPTECTTFATFFDAAQTREEHTTVPIGRPISGTEAYVLDRNGHLVPQGVPGELCIGGQGLARGYLNHAQLTAERFRMHTLPDGRALRLYRTGDRVRWSHTGNLEFLGREDDQIKIRGFRVELGEIESVIVQSPFCLQCAVVYRDVPTGDTNLIAYIVPNSAARLAGAPVAVASIRSLVRERLPDYMVPSGYVLVEAMPVGANGKIDVLSFPQPSDAVRTNEVIAPATRLERAIAEVWEETLERIDIGVQDNFFEVGGHSLLLIRLRSKLQQKLDREIQIIDLFRYPTIRRLAAALSGETYGGGAV
jgi:amino acid adenylation domain-containing protein